MKINALHFGVAGAITSAALWIVCSLFVWMMPGGMMKVSTNMMHAEIFRSGWSISLAGVIWGLFAWSLFAGVFLWLLAMIYNMLTRK